MSGAEATTPTHAGLARAGANVSSTAAVKAGWRPVVTAFVQRHDGRVLVVKRSDKVSTYQGMWGGVSGGVEPTDTSLVDRAYDEIEEEVGIPRRRLRLVCSGRPLPVRDGKRRFLVHPFLMRVEGAGGVAAAATAPAATAQTNPSTAAAQKGAAATLDEGAAGGSPGDTSNGSKGDPSVQLNWENTEARWVLPSELGKLPHVPLLQETLRRLVMPPYMAAHVDHLASDRVHGAAELAAYAVQAFGVVAAYEMKGSVQQHRDLDTQQPCWQAVYEAYHNMAWHVATARPSMAAIANAAADVMMALERELKARADPFGPDATAIRVALLEAVRTESGRLQARGAQLRSRVEALLRPGARVLTTSYSSTVLAALSAAAPRLGRVVCCEARPLCEGAAMAKALAAAGVKGVSVITDAQAGAFVSSVDLVLIGADSLGEGGAVNKVGSYLIALAAREAGVPVYACCDSGKVGICGSVEQLLSVGGGQAGGHRAAGKAGAAGGEEEEKEAEEVVRGWPEGLRDAEALASGAGAAPAAGEQHGGSNTDTVKTAFLGSGAMEVRNVYFEAVPLELLTGGVVTEKGVMSETDIRAEVAAQCERYISSFDLVTLDHPPPEQEGAASAQ